MTNANLDLRSSRHFFIFCLILFISKVSGVLGATFTFVNKCDSTVWPGILSNAGSPVLETTGFELPKNTLRSLLVSTGWSGRFWARTGCSFDASGSGTCATADCGSGQIACAGNGAATPVTLAEFTLGTAGGQDFYDVSLVDGFNLPMMVETTGGSGGCASTGCVVDLNRQCPTELRTSDGGACKSACVAFETPEYCCSGVYGSPGTCKPSVYSSMFKVACPSSYSYAYDDATSTFTCAGADYTITFCPSTPSQKSTKDTTPQTGTENSYQSGQGMTGTSTVTGSVSGSPPGSGVVADGSWLAGLALGDATRTLSFSGLNFAGFASGVFLSFLHL